MGWWWQNGGWASTISRLLGAAHCSPPRAPITHATSLFFCTIFLGLCYLHCAGFGFIGSFFLFHCLVSVPTDTPRAPAEKFPIGSKRFTFLRRFMLVDLSFFHFHATFLRFNVKLFYGQLLHVWCIVVCTDNAQHICLFLPFRFFQGSSTVSCLCLRGS